MQQDEYERMASVEESLWWYKALHGIQAQRLAALKLPVGACVLDAGCGTGGMLLFLRQALSDLDLRGLEFNPEAARMAAAKTSLPITTGSVNAMPYEDASLDAVLSNDVLCHGGVDEATALGEFRRCLKPGGHLLLNLPAYAWMTSSHDIYVHTVRRYTRREVGEKLRQAGYTIRGSGYWNSLLFPLMLVHRLSLGRKQTTSDVKPLPLWLNNLFFSIAHLEEGMYKSGAVLPFGGSVWVWASRP